MTQKRRTIDDVLNRHLRSASAEEMEWAAARVLHRLRSGRERGETIIESVDSLPWGWRSAVIVPAAAAAFLIVALGLVWFGQSRENARSVEGVLYRVAGGNDQLIQPGERIRTGERVRTEGGAGSMLSLPDGSRVEVRAQSELSMQRAEDGHVIHLYSGSIIVNAAKQPTGHLYVQTKDVTVSVVGTVFVVKAEAEGSRVAVLEGEVRVQQGATSRNLTSGEQAASNPVMPLVPVSSEISWSRNANAHLALLQTALALPQQPIVVSPLPPSGAGQSSADSFEVESVRPSDNTAGAGRGSPGGAMSILPSGCGGNYPIQISPGRFAVSGTTLHVLVTWAYGTGPFDYHSCRRISALNLVSGGDGWIRSELWDVQAKIPEGALTYTPEQLRKGDLPGLRRMLQNLLAKRFNLIMRTERKESSGYELTAEKGAPRLTLRSEIDTEFRGVLERQPQGIMMERGIILLKDAPIADLIPILEQDLAQPVIDQTGLTGRYSFVIEYTPLYRLTNGGTPFAGPALFDALPQQTGLRLQKIRKTVEVWVIEHAERASSN